MRFFSFILIAHVSITVLSCSNNKVRITADFDRGSIGHFEEVEPGFVRGTTKHWLKKDSIGGQYYWFYFKAENVKNRRITFEMRGLEGVYRGNPHIIYSDYTQPVLSYDRKIGIGSMKFRMIVQLENLNSFNHSAQNRYGLRRHILIHTRD